MGKGKDGIYVQAAIDRKHEQEAIRISSIKKFRDELRVGQIVSITRRKPSYNARQQVMSYAYFTRYYIVDAKYAHFANLVELRGKKERKVSMDYNKLYILTNRITDVEERMRKKKMNKCPVCGGQLMFEECRQYSVVHFITAHGKASKKAKRRDYGGSEGSFIYCSNEKCDFVTDTDYKSEKHPDIQIFEDEQGFWVERRE